jgi:nitroreductase
VSTDALTYPGDARAATDALTEAAAAAGYAPSIHNTQPWRWRLADAALDLYLERGRVLDVTDPDTRLATLSCGVALHHARLSLAAQGWHTTVARLPKSTELHHLAHLRIAGRAPVDPSAARHLRTIPLRHTDRRPVTGAPVAPEHLAAVRAAVRAEGTWLHVLRPGQVLGLAVAADHAQRGEAAESGWQAEPGYRTRGTRPGGTRIPDALNPGRATLITVPGRDFRHPGHLPVTADHDASAVFAMLYGRKDEQLDWLRAGEALSAAWLTATEHGLSVLPHSAPIEVTRTRQVMRAMIASVGHPYLVLKFGTLDPAAPGPPHAPRLPVDQIVDQRL